MADATTPDDVGGAPPELELCPMCSQRQLDIDWCDHCRRLVFVDGRFRTRAEMSRDTFPSSATVAPAEGGV